MQVFYIGESSKEQKKFFQKLQKEDKTLEVDSDEEPEPVVGDLDSDGEEWTEEDIRRRDCTRGEVVDPYWKTVY